jgi:hypothetical protein
MVPAFSTIQAQAALLGNDWPEYLHDASGSGFTSETLITPTNAATLKAKAGWPITLRNGAACPGSCSNMISTQPAVATIAGNTLVFVGSWNGSEYAICAATCTVGTKSYTSGQVVWSRYLGRTFACGGAPIQGVGSTAAVVNGVVYVGGGGNITFSGATLTTGTAEFFALDGLTGSVLWQQPLGSAPSHYMWSSPAVVNGSVYQGVASQGDCPLVQGQVVRFDAATGQPLNVFSVVPSGCRGGGVWGSPSVDASGDVYVATGNGGSCTTAEPLAVAILKLSPTLGLLSHWQVPSTEQVSDGDFGSTPTMFTGTVTSGGALRSLVGVPNKNGTYYVFDRSNLSAGPVARLKIANGGNCPECGNGSISPSAWDGKWIYVAGGSTAISGTGHAGSLRAFNPNNLGSPVWQRGFIGAILGAVSSSPGLTVVGEATKTVVVDSANGNLAFFSVTSSTFFAAASIAHGVIYQGDNGGVLHAYSLNGT